LQQGALRIDGRVRSRFNQISAPVGRSGGGGGGTATGRLSASSDEDLGGVNLQTIPSRSKTGKKIRGAFVAEDHCDLITYDFSQIELRFMAHYSRDKTLLDAYRKWDCVECGSKGETTDPLHACPVCGAPDGHRKLEKDCAICKTVDVPVDYPKHGFCLGLDIHQITADACGVERYLGKIINFALLYGLGAKGLARHLKITEKLAHKIRDAYFAKYRGIVLHNIRIQEEVMKYGYIRTILGRKRRFPEKKGKRLELWEREWRQAANAKIQGSAADLMKCAMRNTQRRLVKEGLEDETKFILQVHDEMTLETPKTQSDYMCELVRYEMEHCFPIRVPVIAEGSKARSWLEAK
jgi:DNA polymerase-1